MFTWVKNLHYKTYIEDFDETIVIEVYNDLKIEKKKQGKYTILVKLYLSAAFETLDHHILLNKLLWEMMY